MENTINTLDYLVILVYLAGIFFLAYKSRSNKTPSNLVEEQYLAGKSLTIPESLCSIIATEVSALTFLGIPAFAFGKDYSFIQIYFGAIIGRLVIALIMLPKVYDKGLTIYSVMAKNGNINGQRAIAIFYSINKFLAVGVRLFSGSIIVAEFFSVNIYIAVSIICIITFFYTLIGGLKAVVRTDMVQMFLFIIGGIAAHFIIPDISNHSWGELMGQAAAADKMNFFSFTNPWPFIIGMAGGVLFDMATHGVDQDFVQRLTANKSLKGAQFSIITSSFVSILVGFLFLSIGSLLWAHYQMTPLPEMANDKIFAHFITEFFPVGLKGLMVAGVLAATMSTLDSSINALSACLYNDIFHHRSLKAEMIRTFYKRDTLIITLGFMLIAFVASTSDGLLLFGLKITSWTAGSLLAVFFATVIWKISKLTTSNVVLAYIFGITGVYLNTFVLKWNWNFNVYFGFSFSILILILQNALPTKSKD
jgi:SSS family transporter